MKEIIDTVESIADDAAVTNDQDALHDLETTLKALAHYIRNRSKGVQCRHDGNIQDAQTFEDIAERHLAITRQN